MANLHQVLLAAQNKFAAEVEQALAAAMKDETSPPVTLGDLVKLADSKGLEFHIQLVKRKGAKAEAALPTKKRRYRRRKNKKAAVEKKVVRAMRSIASRGRKAKKK